MEFDATFLVTIISFVLFVFIMNAIFYAPILRIMKNREKVVETNFNDAKNIKEEILSQENYHNKELELSRDEARKALELEISKLKSEKSHIINEYKSELFKNVTSEKENLRNSAFEAEEILKDSVVDIAKNISNVLLGSKINNELINKSQVEIKEEQV